VTDALASAVRDGSAAPCARARAVRQLCRLLEREPCGSSLAERPRLEREALPEPPTHSNAAREAQQR
jgi:hypothetical protein